MKTPSNYGSENEETNFIRRVAAPDRPNSKRRQKNRLALAGAATMLLGASAGVGYATLKSAQSEAVATPSKQQMAASLEVPDFVDSLGDPYYPSFEELDQDGDGIVAYDEYMRDLNQVWAKNKEDIANSDLPDVIKEDLNSQLNSKIESDTACVKKAMVPTKKRKLTWNEDTIDSLYYMLEVYCFETPIEIPQKLMDQFPTTQAPAAPPAPVEEEKKVEVETPEGPVTVTIDGPVIGDKQEVTIESADGTTTTTTVDVTQTSDGKTELDIPTGPGGETTTVTVPSTGGEGGYPTGGEGGYPTSSEGEKKVEVETPEGPVTVTIDGPVIGDKQEVTIESPDGTTTTTTVDVTQTSDGKTELDIPTGPGGETTTVTVPSTGGEGGYPTGGEGGYPTSSEGEKKVEVETPEGPVTVTIDGPVIGDKQEVTIESPDGTTTTTTVDVTQTSDGKTELDIPTGPGGETTTVTVPSTGGEGGYPTGGEGGYPTSSEGEKKVEVETPEGPVTVTIDGPVIGDKQEVTIESPDGTTTTTTVDVTQTSDGKTELDIPTGPGGETTTVTVPSTGGEVGQTTTDILNQLGGNDINNGDKDFMTKDEFQLQIGTHFSEKIMALEKQTHDEEIENNKLLDQQKQLQDCILQAANQFGYYGVYEQPPFFRNAVDWVDNNCLKQ